MFKEESIFKEMSRAFSKSSNSNFTNRFLNPCNELIDISECHINARNIYFQHSNSLVSLDSLETFFNSKLEQLDRLASEGDLCGFGHMGCSWSTDGRLGPSRVSFDTLSNIGSVKITGYDRMTLLGQSGFSTIKANVALFKGKWMYELTLITKGVMQVGWATHRCNFSQEQGVGDTKDSYAYDGNRVRKWNLNTQKYGQLWNCGDIIGCAIDLDNGTVDFYRNGNHLGQAFSKLRLGPGYGYFPTISLAYGESLTANFGVTRLRYPVKGYQPLEAIPFLSIHKADLMLDWLLTLTPLRITSIDEDICESSSSTFFSGAPTTNLTVQSYLVASIVLKKLSSLLMNRFINEFCLVRKLVGCSTQAIQDLLDLLWAVLEKSQVQEIIDHLVIALVNSYHFLLSHNSPLNANHVNPAQIWSGSYHFSENGSSIRTSTQKEYLFVILSLIQHSQTRNYLLRNVLFDKIKFSQLFLDQTVVDDKILEREFFSHLTVETLQSPEAYRALRSVDIENSLSDLESLHQIILDTLIFQDEVCRVIFISKFDLLLKEINSTLNIFPHHLPTSLTSSDPSPATLSIFHRLTSLIRVQYENMLDSIPISFFTDSTCVSSDIGRTGGLVTHLNKTYDKELGKSNSKSLCENPLMKHVCILIDGLVRLYSNGAHKQLAKYCAVRDNLVELIESVRELKNLPADEETSTVIENSVSVLEKELLLRARQLAYINSTVLTRSKRADIYWLLKLLLNTLDNASQCGYHFSFVPDYQIETCLNLCHAIRFFFGNSESFIGAKNSSVKNSLSPFGAATQEEKEEYRKILSHFCNFIAVHFGDERIVNADLRESIAQALASLVSNADALRILEEIPYSSRLKMLKSLTAPYENRAWGQSNWILLRMWKGNGFAFRHTATSNIAFKLTNPQTNKESFSNLSLLSPCPSPKFQRELAEYLTISPDASNAFITSLLSQLNWSFSEFIGMLQEIQNARNRPEKAFVDSRQLKICCTCFELTLALLRVLEMIANINHKLILAPRSNDLILPKLATTLNQILNRITVPTGCFEYVIDLNMIGLELVNHISILSAVTGLVVSLVLREETQDREAAIDAFVSDANFLPSSFLFLVGKTAYSSGRIFRFEDHTEVSPQEVSRVSNAVDLIIARHTANEITKSNENISEDDLCTICYANKKTAQFVPCDHRSCKACISTHFMRHQECFFCKAIIDRAILTDSNQVIFPESNDRG